VRWVVLLARRQASAEFSTAALTNSRGIHSIVDQKAPAACAVSLALCAKRARAPRHEDDRKRGTLRHWMIFPELDQRLMFAVCKKLNLPFYRPILAMSVYVH